MRFCQTDGTPLVEVTAEKPPDDPYKTMVASQEEIAAAIPIDPFATMIGGMPLKIDEEEEVLELPDNPEPPKTPISQENIQTQIKTSEPNTPQVESPASPFSSPPPTYPPPTKSSGDLEPTPPAPPKFNEPSLNPPSFGDVSPTKESSSEKSASTDTAPPFESAGQSPFDKPVSPPIPSPFDMSMPPGYHPPTTPPFAEPEKSSTAEKDSFNQSPFGQPQPLEQANWSPPPAPDANWQNQQIGQNTPFQPPPSGQSVNQTLPIVSLVLGILSLCCYVSPLTGIAALITGFLGMKNANNDPANYGGKPLAIAGMIMGGLFLLIGIAYWIFVFVVGFSGFIPR